MDNRARRPVWPHFEGEIGKLREMRFWSHVDMRGPDECWDWQASRNGKAYGRFKATSHTILHANRVAWALMHRKDPGALVVRHTCDRPMCCNPHHLKLGTHGDNMADKVSRGRCWSGDQSGAANGAAKLDDEQLAALVGRMKLGLNNKQCAEGLPVGHSMVSKIRTGVMWRDQTAALGWTPRPQFNRKPQAHLNAAPAGLVAGSGL